MTVYCTKGNVIFNTDANQKDEKKSKGFKIKRNVVNPIFEKMRSHNEDPFWDMFLLKASRDNFPKGFSYNDFKLYYSLKSKYNFQIRLDEEKSDYSFAELKEFVTNKGILSESDKLRINDEQEESFNNFEQITIDNWKDLGKLQMNSVFTYISVLTQKYDLNIRERKNLESIIRIGISSGYLNTKNIVVENSYITNIIPLIWNEDKRVFNIDTKNTKIKKYKGTKTDNVDLSTDNTTTCLDFDKKHNISNINKRWEKFLKVVYKNKIHG